MSAGLLPSTQLESHHCRLWNPQRLLFRGTGSSKLKARGFVSHRALAEELNRKGIPAPRGGRWYQFTVIRALTRLGLITVGEGRTNKRLAVKQSADARARALASTIRKLRKAGFVAISAITRELNERQVPPAWGSKWHRSTVRRLLQRLEGLEPN
jgi:hypothetical protein